MRIDKSRSSSNVSSSRKTSPSGDRGAFTSAMSGSDAPSAARSTSSTVGVSSVAAIMVLQGAEDPLEKRRRSERRGRQMLEALDALKLDVLSERNPEAALKRLAQAMESERDQTDDPELESVIDQIELRVAVELAKYKSSHRR